MQTKRFRDKNGHYYIRAQYYNTVFVRWGREELDDVVNYNYTTVDEFEKMIKDEGWTEEGLE